jgi:hypothetical protein
VVSKSGGANSKFPPVDHWWLLGGGGFFSSSFSVAGRLQTCPILSDTTRVTNTLRHEERRWVVGVCRVPTRCLKQVATYAKAAHSRSFVRLLKWEQDNIYVVVRMPLFSVLSQDASTSTRYAHIRSRIVVGTPVLGSF